MEAKEQPIVLVLTREEASTLRDVTMFISGHNVTSRRRHMDSIQTQLTELGFRPADYRRDDIFDESDICFF